MINDHTANPVQFCDEQARQNRKIINEAMKSNEERLKSEKDKFKELDQDLDRLQAQKQNAYEQGDKKREREIDAEIKKTENNLNEQGKKIDSLQKQVEQEKQQREQRYHR